MEIFQIREKLGIRVYGNLPPAPCISFAHFNFNPKLMSRLSAAELSTPTPIQAQVS